jgi:hypothetical protein
MAATTSLSAHDILADPALLDRLKHLPGWGYPLAVLFRYDFQNPNAEPKPSIWHRISSLTAVNSMTQWISTNLYHLLLDFEYI